MKDALRTPGCPEDIGPLWEVFPHVQLLRHSETTRAVVQWSLDTA
jgi:hypothetical protein